MPNACFTVFAKFGRLLNSQVQLVNFLKPWYGVANHTNNILICLQKKSPLPLGLDVSLDLPFKAEKKTTLKTFRISKKLKYMNNPKVAEEAYLTTLRDKWLIACGKPMPKTKVQMKKAAKVEKKKAKKESKARKKSKRKSQTIDIRKLTINNSQKIVKKFKKILSDVLTGFEAFNDTISNFSRPETSNNAIPDLPRPDSSSSTPKNLLGNNARLSNSQKKKATQQTLVERLKNKALTSK